MPDIYTTHSCFCTLRAGWDRKIAN